MSRSLRRSLLPVGAAVGIALAAAGSLAWCASERGEDGASDPERAAVIAGATTNRRAPVHREHAWPRAQVEGCRSGDATAPSILLPGPTRATRDRMLADLPRPPGIHRRNPPPEGFPALAQATEGRAPVFARRNPSVPVSYVRRGRRVRVRPTGGTPPWYELRGGGFLSTGHGFVVAHEAHELPIRHAHPDLRAPLPYRYGRVTRDGTPRYRSWPPATGDPEDADPPVERTQGVVFVAIAEHRVYAGVDYLALVDGTYLRADAVAELHPPPLHGQRLGPQIPLPIGFVYRERTPLYRPQGPHLRRCGHAVRMSRFRVLGQRTLDGRTYYEAPDGVLVPKSAVRVARNPGRPGYISDRTRWIHVDLSEQTLVAYLGPDPVLATLVSTGKAGRATPTGHYRIHWKQVSVTMSGRDPKTGGYEVADVPWTMYYRSLYALHGAYWHTRFGRVRSHGCTNLPPADAWWLFHWTRPVLPAGWHSVRTQGTRVVITP